MCVSIGVRVAAITTRTMGSCAPYIGTLPASVPSNVFLFLIARNSAGFPLCAFAPLHICASAPLRLCASVLLSSQRCSGLSAALVSHLLSSHICSRLCSAVLSALVFSLPHTHCVRLIHIHSYSAIGPPQFILLLACLLLY